MKRIAHHSNVAILPYQCNRIEVGLFSSTPPWADLEWLGEWRIVTCPI